MYGHVSKRETLAAYEIESRITRMQSKAPTFRAKDYYFRNLDEGSVGDRGCGSSETNIDAGMAQRAGDRVPHGAKR